MGTTQSTRQSDGHASPTARRNRLRDNIERTRERVARAAEQSGRSADDVRLIAVTKKVEVDIIRMALDLGLTDLGENRVQSLSRRAAMAYETFKRKRTLAEDSPARATWHMIGHLQRNKVRAAIEWSQIIHSVDSLRLAEQISTDAAARDLDIDIFLQINVAGEKTKHGAAVGAINLLVEEISPLPNVNLVGLMTMAPFIDDEARLRSTFARLRELADDLRTRGTVTDRFTQLSMGMSHDFEYAIQEGATMVRVGSALFEGLHED